jgi:hypothetical protein
LINKTFLFSNETQHETDLFWFSMRNTTRKQYETNGMEMENICEILIPTTSCEEFVLVGFFHSENLSISIESYLFRWMCNCQGTFCVYTWGWRWALLDRWVNRIGSEPSRLVTRLKCFEKSHMLNLKKLSVLKNLVK